MILISSPVLFQQDGTFMFLGSEATREYLSTTEYEGITVFQVRDGYFLPALVTNITNA